MPLLHDCMLMDVITERRRLSRRQVVAGSARIATGAALGSSLATRPSIDRSALAQEPQSDLDVLNFLLTLEHLTHAFFRDGIERLTFGADSRGVSIDDNLVVIRDQEAAHVATLTQIVSDLGGIPVSEATYDFGTSFDDAVTFLETAMALENTGVSAYDGAAPLLSDPDLLTTAAAIVAVEARHASYLTFLNGSLPFPAAFETPLAPATVLGIAGPFIVS